MRVSLIYLLVFAWEVTLVVQVRAFSTSNLFDFASKAKEFVATKVVSGVPYLEDIVGDCPVTYNCTALRQDFEKNVFGQSIAIEYILDAMLMHWSNPVKFKVPLSFNFYGMSGTGKSLVAGIIVRNVLKYGIKSPYFVYFSGSKFQQSEIMDARIRIKEVVSRCPRSIILFEDVEQFPNSLWYYFDDFYSKPSYDLSQAIFIFTTRIGETVIKKATHDIFAEGFSRKEYFAKKFNGNELFVHQITTVLSNSFEFREALEKHVVLKYVLYHVPFFPMDAEVVKECIKKTTQITNAKQIKSLMRRVDFTNDVVPVSTHGCKLIDSIVDQEIHTYKLNT